MSKLLIVLSILIGSILLWNYAKPESVKKTSAVITPGNISPTVIPQSSIKKYVFVPYWSFKDSIVADKDETLIYFGIGVNEEGIEVKDKGYQNIDNFIDMTKDNNERILAVRMIDKNLNAKIIQDVALQKEIAIQAVKIAVENKFDGILLDYETSAFGFDSTTQNITSFYELFSEKVKASNLDFNVTLYGDSYFRARPYDVKKIGQMSDKVIIMAYDFSKSRGNPGPNFPLADNKEYGYDFGKMINDFQGDIDNKKIAVALGYFGYDWRTNSKGEAVSNGVPLSTNEIKNEFVSSCKYENCKLLRLKDSQEPYISYTDDGGDKHIIWYEDSVSANIKENFLRNKGILQIAYWAYSYY